MAISETEHELIEALAEEVSAAINRGVSFWMTRVEDVFQDRQLTTLGRLQRIREIVEEYRRNEYRIPMVDVRREFPNIWKGHRSNSCV